MLKESVLSHTIAYLADHPSCIPTLAAWHHAQWRYLDVDMSVEQRAAALGTHTKDRIPMTVVALAGETPLGSASLIAHDMDTRMHLSPWLASVYVAPAYRNRGLGSALVQRIAAEAGMLRLERLYLFTPDKEHFYTRLGWTVLERTVYRGYDQVVMVRHITHNELERE
jgi:GNAT superfamily N-acetyltransferase